MATVKLRMSLPEGPIGAVVWMDDPRARSLSKAGLVSLIEEPAEEPADEESEVFCMECGFEAVSPRGLATHRRIHE